MRTTSQQRASWSPHCNSANMATVLLHSGAKITVDRHCVEAFTALDVVMNHHHYHPRTEDTGAYVCRQITNGTGYSLHAYGIAGDFNWSTNPYGDHLVTDMPRAMTDDIQAILTLGEIPVFRWGGDFNGDDSRNDGIYDAMHYEVNCTPGNLRRGIDWSTVAGHTPDPDSSRPEEEEEEDMRILKATNKTPIVVSGSLVVGVGPTTVNALVADGVKLTVISVADWQKFADQGL